MPDDLNLHVEWTKNEWSTNPYMTSVIDYLSQNKIESFIDFGGCTGEFTKLVLDKVDSVKVAVIFEPVEENFLFIESNVIDSRVEVINKALYQTADKISLGRIDNNVGGWSINYGDGNDMVDCITMEEVVKTYNPDFVKIDIEGSERNVIENSSSINSIKYLEIEFHDQYLEPEKWIEYSAEYLKNHKLVLFGDSYCRQNGFFVRRDCV